MVDPKETTDDAFLGGALRILQPKTGFRAGMDSLLLAASIDGRGHILDVGAGAGVVGLDVRQLYALTFGLGLACVGAAGALLVTIADAAPALGPAYTLLAFIIVIIGGMGSMTGALVGGVLIGVSEALAGFLFAPSMKSMFSFALLIAVLVLRPQGLMGQRP